MCDGEAWLDMLYWNGISDGPPDDFGGESSKDFVFRQLPLVVFVLERGQAVSRRVDRLRHSCLFISQR